MKIVVEDNLINYLDLGDKEKPVLIFLHGWLDSLASFKELTNYLQNDFRLILFDLPGFGDSTIVNKNWTVSDYVNFVTTFVDKLDVNPYAYVGHSFGGRILIKGFGTDKFKAEKLILIGAAGIKESSSFKNLAFYFFAKIVKALLKLPLLNKVESLAKTYFYNLIGSDYLNSSHLSKIYQNILDEDLQKYADDINTKTLLIYGENDKSTPVKYGQIFNRLIKNSTLEIISNTTHFVHKEKPFEVAQAIINFLKK